MKYELTQKISTLEEIKDTSRPACLRFTDFLHDSRLDVSR